MAYSPGSFSLISKGYNEARKNEVTANTKAGEELPVSMTTEEMQETIIMLSKAVVELTDKVNAMEKGEMK